MPVLIEWLSYNAILQLASSCVQYGPNSLLPSPLAQQENIISKISNTKTSLNEHFLFNSIACADNLANLNLICSCPIHRIPIHLRHLRDSGLRQIHITSSCSSTRSSLDNLSIFLSAFSGLASKRQQADPTVRNDYSILEDLCMGDGSAVVAKSILCYWR